MTRCEARVEIEIQTHAHELASRRRRGERTEKDALNLMERITTMKIRLLGDRVSRSTAWKIASDLDWDDTAAAEYLAVAGLQADRFVTLDPKLRRAADGIVPLAEIAELYEPRA